MIKILANDGIHPDGKLLLEEANFIVDTESIPQEELMERLPAYDVLIVRSATQVTKELIDHCPNLKMICRGGVGMDNIDVEYARSKGIRVENTPAASSNSVAELVFGHIFSLARGLHAANRQMPNKGDKEFKNLKKSFSKGFEIRGKKIGILGFGRIGQEVARIALGVGMTPLAVDPFVDEAEIKFGLLDHEGYGLSMKVQTIPLEKMLREADIITLHVPGGKKPVIGKEEIAKMKDGVVIINAARGGSIDEDALLENLENGKLAGVGLDVFLNEPTPRADILNHPKISLSPHTGASTIQAQVNIAHELAEKIIAELLVKVEA